MLKACGSPLALELLSCSTNAEKQFSLTGNTLQVLDATKIPLWTSVKHQFHQDNYLKFIQSILNGTGLPKKYT